MVIEIKGMQYYEFYILLTLFPKHCWLHYWLDVPPLSLIFFEKPMNTLSFFTILDHDMLKIVFSGQVGSYFGKLEFYVQIHYDFLTT